MSKPRTGKEVRIIKTVRVEPRILVKIIEVYGSFTKFVNEKINKDRRLK